MSESTDLTLKSIGILGPSISIIKGKKPSVIYPRPVNLASHPYILIESFGRAYRQYTDDSSCRLAYEDDVLIVWDGERAGLTSHGHSGYIGSTLAAIRINEESLDSKYLFYVLEKERDSLRGSSEGTGVPHLSRWAVENIKYFKPKKIEQKKIAIVLSSADDVIEKTRAQIEKLKDLKTGMMQELLTQGIGHTEFKDSPIGKIPKTWSMIKVQELLADTKYALRSGPFGSALLKSELVNSGIPLLGIDNVHVEELRSVFKRFVSNEKFQELRKYRVFPNDVMVTIMGTVGRCCVVPEDFGIALSSKHVWTLSLDKEKYFPELLCWQINFSDWVKKQFLNESQGGVMESISSSTLKSLMVPVPPIEEQKKIVDVHKILSKRIMRKSDQLRTLIDLKKALMQDLLTGKVRVKVDSPETVAA